MLHALGARMAPGNARRYLHALPKAKDLVAPAGPRAGVCSDNTDVFSCTRSSHVLWWPWGQAGSLNASVLPAFTRGDKFWSQAQHAEVKGTCPDLPSREKGFKHLSTTDFLQQFLCIEGEVITHFIKTLWTWFYLLI